MSKEKQTSDKPKNGNDFIADVSSRFISVKELSNLMKQRDEIIEKISSFNTQHCRVCGDTQPKHGFYPLWGMAVGEGIYETSGLICNRCARTDKEYGEIFGEPKEQFESNGPRA